MARSQMDATLGDPGYGNRYVDDQNKNLRTFPRFPQMSSSPQNPFRSHQATRDQTDRWNAFSPFQSDSVREIRANMTDAERSAANRDGLIFGGLYGIWCAFSCVAPVMLILLGLASGDLRPAVALVGVLLIVVHLALIPVVQRRQRRLLCNTSWARENGIDPDTLKLLKWPNKSTTK